jgi:hypothetical protein
MPAGLANSQIRRERCVCTILAPIVVAPQLQPESTNDVGKDCLKFKDKVRQAFPGTGCLLVDVIDPVCRLHRTSCFVWLDQALRCLTLHSTRSIGAVQTTHAPGIRFNLIRAPLRRPRILIARPHTDGNSHLKHSVLAYIPVLCRSGEFCHLRLLS